MLAPQLQHSFQSVCGLPPRNPCDASKRINSTTIINGTAQGQPSAPPVGFFATMYDKWNRSHILRKAVIVVGLFNCLVMMIVSCCVVAS